MHSQRIVQIKMYGDWQYVAAAGIEDKKEIDAQYDKASNMFGGSFPVREIVQNKHGVYRIVREDSAKIDR